MISFVSFVSQRTGLTPAEVSSRVQSSDGLPVGPCETDFPYFAFDRNESVQADERGDTTAAALYDTMLGAYQRSGTGTACFGYLAELAMNAGASGLFGSTVGGTLPQTVDIGERAGLVAMNFSDPSGKALGTIFVDTTPGAEGEQYFLHRAG